MSASAAEPTRAPRWRRVVRRIVALLLLAALASSPWWARAGARRLAFFRVRRVEIVGLRYLAPSAVMRQMRVDTTVSVWDPLGPIAERVERLPQVHEARVERRLPGTLVVSVSENLPVALVPSPTGFHAYDASGRALPIDPSRAGLDLPILDVVDRRLLRLLGDVKTTRPRIFARIDEVRRVGRDEVLFHLATLPVRTMADVAVERLDEIGPVEQDLARRQARISELDLRYRDQVIARLQ